MKWNQVTWYSALLALSVYLTLPFIGFYLAKVFDGRGSVPIVDNSKQATASSKNSNSNSGSNINIKTDKITFTSTFTNGVLKYSGSLQLPSPCHKLKDETVVMESYPEQVQIRFKVESPDPGAICAQVITYKEFSNELKVSPQAKISVYLNQAKIY